MNTAIENTLSAIIGIGMIVAIAIGTVLIVPAIIMISMAKVDCDTWSDAVKDVYINMPADYLMCRV